MAVNENGSDTQPDFKRKRAPRSALLPIHEAAMRIAEIGALPRSKTRDLVSLLLTHGARAWRSTQPEVQVHLHVRTPAKRKAVRIRFQ
ncbi:hypothetical protein BJF93_22330 [Xaviernesmea oryzae]|uniref:Uncharacterized protein n=1 Tax=Xaviernesmea oryzae TaxID=464029 RepID=A0A1Q9AYM5_9HYPH|nr:hypothetical protein [Xaviernesmea oryzae]OLP60548.1 hypothetical protein BJF93_22330 [Xaviernesmea oryzae]SEM28800.1 hypothetical protein SAMN04487976_1277 [Xaviernesmea oryzae]